MKNQESLEKNRPFKNLKSMLKHHGHSIGIPDSGKTDKVLSTGVEFDKPSEKQDDEALFLEAMADVKPISKNKKVKKTQKQIKHLPPSSASHREEEKEVQTHLSKLVEKGIGFEVSSTPEYMEGTNYNVHPEISKRLHKGEFSIQDHVDLHGLTVLEAEKAFNDLFKQATTTGVRCLLIIHGRGLSSPGKPVLKAKVFEWLSYGPWRKWVIAFSSARGCDGGAGATYVLLRKSPLTKRHRKKNIKTTNIY